MHVATKEYVLYLRLSPHLPWAMYNVYPTLGQALAAQAELVVKFSRLSNLEMRMEIRSRLDAV